MKLYSKKHLNVRVFMYLNVRICYKCFPEFGPKYLMLTPFETRFPEKLHGPDSFSYCIWPLLVTFLCLPYAGS